MSRSCRQMVVLALLLTLGMSAWFGVNEQITAFPLSDAGATATASLKVHQTQVYAISLQYSYKEGDQAARADVWKLAGGYVQEAPGRWSEPGAPLRVQVRVVQKLGGSERQVVERIVDKPRLSSWGSGHLNAELAAIPLSPGSYRITVVSLDEAPSFAGARTSLLVGKAYRGK